MSKLASQGAISPTLKKGLGTKRTAITTVKKKPKTTYKVPPLTLRMSIEDKQLIAEWVDDLQAMTQRNVSAAKLFRALTLERENIDDDKLVELINLMN